MLCLKVLIEGGPNPIGLCVHSSYITSLIVLVIGEATSNNNDVGTSLLGCDLGSQMYCGSTPAPGAINT